MPKKSPIYFQCRLVISHGTGQETWTMVEFTEKVAMEGMRFQKKDSKDKRIWTVVDVYRTFPHSEEWAKNHHCHGKWRVIQNTVNSTCVTDLESV